MYRSSSNLSRPQVGRPGWGRVRHSEGDSEESSDGEPVNSHFSTKTQPRYRLPPSPPQSMSGNTNTGKGARYGTSDEHLYSPSLRDVSGPQARGVAPAGTRMYGSYQSNTGQAYAAPSIFPLTPPMSERAVWPSGEQLQAPKSVSVDRRGRQPRPFDGRTDETQARTILTPLDETEQLYARARSCWAPPTTLPPIFENCLGKAVAILGLAKCLPSESGGGKRAVLHLSYAALAACSSLVEKLAARHTSGAVDFNDEDDPVEFDLMMQAMRLERCLLKVVSVLSNETDPNISASSRTFDIILATCTELETLYQDAPKVAQNSSLCRTELHNIPTFDSKRKGTSSPALERMTLSLKKILTNQANYLRSLGSIRKLNVECARRQCMISWEIADDGDDYSATPYRCRVFVDDVLVGAGEGSQSSTAQEKAAQVALSHLSRTPPRTVNTHLPPWSFSGLVDSS